MKRSIAAILVVIALLEGAAAGAYGALIYAA
jgi:hypothetical protein